MRRTEGTAYLTPVRLAGDAPLWLATHEAARAVTPDALVPPGLADAAVWRAEWPQALTTEQDSMIVAGLGRKA